jgi:hypothetical protein
MVVYERLGVSEPQLKEFEIWKIGLAGLQFE